MNAPLVGDAFTSGRVADYPLVAIDMGTSTTSALYGQVPASGSKWPSFLIVEVFLERLGIARFGQAQHQQNACLLRTQIVRQHTSNLPERKR